MSIFTRSSLSGRDFLKELDFTVAEWEDLLDLARELKAEKRTGNPRHRLAGKNIAVLFEKASTRTRCAFEVAAYDEGAHVTYLDPTGSHLGHKESVADTARVLSRMYDAIEYRGFAQDVVQTLADYADVPVWNGLTDQWHPTQALCDMLTMTEHVTKPASQISFAYVGDAHNNVANSLLVAGAMLGMDVRMVAPEDLQNPAEVRGHAVAIASETGARLLHTDDVARGVSGVDFLYTDVWVSMGEPEEIWKERITKLSPYQVNRAMLEATGNPEVKVLHCLPAFHDRNTEVGEHIFATTGMTGLEVTDEVFESRHSIVFDQAENRMHTIKAIMVATIGEG